MKTIDFNKYAGIYTVTEAKMILENLKADILSAEAQQDLAEAEKNHGPDFIYELRKGTSVNLQELKIGQRVCASRIKGYHILMTQK